MIEKKVIKVVKTNIKTLLEVSSRIIKFKYE